MQDTSPKKTNDDLAVEVQTLLEAVDSDTARKSILNALKNNPEARAAFLEQLNKSSADKK